jgi:hypothetical protein
MDLTYNSRKTREGGKGTGSRCFLSVIICYSNTENNRTMGRPRVKYAQFLYEFGIL